MKYKLTVIKYEENKNYEQEIARFKENERFNLRNMPISNGIYSEEPQRELAERSLEVFLTGEEYEKLKSEIIKIFK